MVQLLGQKTTQRNPTERFPLGIREDSSLSNFSAWDSGT